MDKKRNNNAKYFILLFSIFLISFSIASASSGITKWNSVTEDNSSVFSVDIGIDESKEVEFGVSSGLDYDWTWSVNGKEEEEIKETDGAYWNVTVSLVIGEENDARELEGLEDYTLRISERPERIISMAPSCTEILFAIGAGDSVVGVTEYCDYPSEVEGKKDKGEIEVIGGYSTPSFEKIVNSEPDLIVSAYGNPDDVIYRVVEFGYPVYAQNPKNIEDIFNHIKVIGAITKHDETASSLLNELKERLEEIGEKTELLEEEQRPRVFYNIGDFFTAGKETFANEIIEIAGGKNIAAYKSGYFLMNLEELIDKNPQVIICDSGHGGMSIAYEQIVSDERLKNVSAVENNRVYKIDTNIISRSGPRVVEAVEVVHADYGDFFNEEEEEGEKKEEKKAVIKAVEGETIERREGKNSNLFYVFEEYGIYNVCVVGNRDSEEEKPIITAWEPVEARVNNAEGESRTFSVYIDQPVDIVWQINGTEVQTDEDVTEASYTNTSAVLGTWNVSAIATNIETGLSGIHTWVWNVTPALATTAPTPSVNITTTPSPTPSLIPTLTPTPTLVIISTSTPTPTPKEKQKTREEEIPEPPGFEVFFAVIGLLAVMYLLRRNGFKNA
jgi:iron complex transport system substrate-binding protein